MTGPINGRRKGAKAELEVVRLLTDWWRQIEPAADFCRTPLSGGWGNATRRGSYKASGDIMTSSRTFPFTVEVKRREEFTWRLLLGGFRSPVWRWWAQTVAAAAEEGGTPALWLRRSEEPWRVMLPAEFVTDLRAEALLAKRFLVAPRLDVRTAEQGRTSEQVSIVSATALLAVPPASVLELLGVLPG